MTLRHFKNLIHIILENNHEKIDIFRLSIQTENDDIFTNVSMSFGSPLYLE